MISAEIIFYFFMP